MRAEKFASNEKAELEDNETKSPNDDDDIDFPSPTYDKVRIL